RPATLDDVDELVRLRWVMMEALGVRDEPSWRPACARLLTATLADGTTAAVVAEHPDAAGRLVACGVGRILVRLPGPRTPDGRYGHIASMVTEPAWRRRGLASGIVQGLLDWFAGQGVRKVDLHASPEGAPVYRALGFTEGEFPELGRLAILG
ncbi:MAG TPA: GNAT family N-acetyltransferase, partial [Acidimicrobiales bacterium]|nr:GNAT family N-acetyltransferase [Acidimicrobiales bacterium]